MTHDRAFQVCIGVVFAGLVVAVVETGGRELFEPDLKIVNQAVLPVVHINTRGDVHCRHEHHAFLDPALLHDRGNIVSDPNELLPFLRVEPQVLCVEGHSARLASALMSSCASHPARDRRRPAAAIIAALSVESARSGTNTGSCPAAPRIPASARKRVFAETPPAIPTLRA